MAEAPTTVPSRPIIAISIAILPILRPQPSRLRCLLPGEHAFGEFGSAVLLDEVAGLDAGVRLTRRAGNVLDQRTVRLPEYRVAITEDGKERFVPPAQGFPCRAVGRYRRIVG